MNYSENVLNFIEQLKEINIYLSFSDCLFNYNMQTGDVIGIRQFKLDCIFTLNQLLKIRDFLNARELKLDPQNWESGTIDVIPVY